MINKHLEMRALLNEAILNNMPILIQAFEHIQIAEKCILLKQIEYPKKSDKIASSFIHLITPQVIAILGATDVYEAHCLELLDRVAHDQSLEKITDGETMAILALASLKAPLTKDYMILYARIFKKLGFDKKFNTEVSEYIETFNGAVEEIHTQLIRKYKRI